MCAKIVSEIILSSNDCLFERIQELHQFVQANLEENAPAALEPFLDRLCQLYGVLEKKKHEKSIKLTFSEAAIIGIINNPKKS